MTKTTAKLASDVLSKVANFFVISASPVTHRPEIPQELKKQ
ncbi:cyclic lactone autoinducer peptide [Paenibacillus flagellatus]|uniref:Cyclic lactone autoinducer peptide n=1 Tax=Paenibacillus flagellatus TaxID=2211139 RepID=A0A2V5KRN6_9BACL|nr:cyclic lactone autoinducer peptide [Paenibacillus flagellatus]PYI51556.1 cyclic lactone autoinducer peptide [Paenibacillus flagellatus]